MLTIPSHHPTQGGGKKLSGYPGTLSGLDRNSVRTVPDRCPDVAGTLSGNLRNAVRHPPESCPDQIGIAVRIPPEYARDQQFGVLHQQRHEFTQSGYPIISVDTKKKELVGQFKNHGRVWSREPIQVQDHDFRSQAQGMAIPYGIYDLQANRARVVVGLSHDTPAFAVDAICLWWRQEGRHRYPNAPELLILADSGGSNGPRCGAWKLALQEKLVDPYQLGVTVCHYPTGASKWNPVEHRLFSEISKHWAGQPLSDYETIVRLIRGTRTGTGLAVHCTLNTRHYPTDVKISRQQLEELDVLKSPVLPEWNYTLLPRENRN